MNNLCAYQMSHLATRGGGGGGGTKWQTEYSLIKVFIIFIIQAAVAIIGKISLVQNTKKDT